MAIKNDNIEISTVSVIEFGDSITEVVSMKSFMDTPEGNQLAEEYFSSCMLSHGGHSEDVDAAIEDGHFEGDGCVFLLTHST